jgi:hypothetical protein
MNESYVRPFVNTASLEIKQGYHTKGGRHAEYTDLVQGYEKTHRTTGLNKHTSPIGARNGRGRWSGAPATEKVNHAKAVRHLKLSELRWLCRIPVADCTREAGT